MHACHYMIIWTILSNFHVLPKKQIFLNYITDIFTMDLFFCRKNKNTLRHMRQSEHLLFYSNYFKNRASQIQQTSNSRILFRHYLRQLHEISWIRAWLESLCMIIIHRFLIINYMSGATTTLCLSLIKLNNLPIII